ncbi:PREDICTED: probable methyltransferase BTM2 homolog [Dinoponera quadriceps]|uniref:S-adenosylmethionine sensor upstream of mTORC1 n=1 Tax=Dinoponera quadriceps TaxID=609295 RepID=A0A6P3YB71_DINQU|nr:PREDICTED: probable methyltransferase BTM2 homolog [Dinoponera quadriceps]XP_014488356.1 PREDICTED: probable methyltransferase BTM2 homolog [Dinoponera quadriceps]XP_014488449.1 PREDICTED: probable methyltransferase BTM2 homolog [Dinoponera quadriceps]
MATEEHKRLSDIVKGTHAFLRAEAQQYGAEAAWERHVSRGDVLQKYAASMRELATKCWTENYLNPKNDTYCRMEWIKTQCKEYFLNGGKEKYDERERNISTKISSGESSSENFQIFNDSHGYVENKLQNIYGRRVSLLDVGSCYNPLGNEDEFNVTAIDLTPATSAVLRCDFLNVMIGEKEIRSQDKREFRQLAVNSFDVVVFSLLLEYLPCPRQRYICCRNAYNVLKSAGVLIIVSPDSKHVGANTKLIKSWRYTLSKLGFMRIKYEKLRHIHCLVFRKCACKNVATRWADLQHFTQDEEKYISDREIFIPQDFPNICSKGKQENNIYKYDESDLINTFSELPFDKAF